MIGNNMRPWTGEADRRLHDLHAMGRSTISLAAALKRTRSAVRNRLNMLRVQPGDNPSGHRYEADAQ